MATTSTSHRSSYRPGKAPLLLDDSPAAVRAYLHSLSFFFATKDKALTTAQQIYFAGGGLIEQPALSAWFENNAEAWVELGWEAFVTAFLKEALPPDYVWDRRTVIRENKMGTRDVREWMREVRGLQLEIGSGAMGDLRLVEELLFNMDSELRRTLRRDPVLAKSGLTEEELDNLGVARRLQHSTPPPAVVVDPPTSTSTTSTPTVLVAPAYVVSYPAFERRAYELWQDISSRRADAASAASTVHRRAARAAITTTTTTTTPRQQPRTTSTTTTVAADSTTRLPRLTDREKDYLSEHSGCFKCRRINAGHRGDRCPNGFATTNVVVPAGWQPTSSESTESAPVSSLRALHLSLASDYQQQQEEGLNSLPSSEDSDFDSECVDRPFPPLLARVGRGSRSLVLKTLADSGASASFLAGRVVEALGLERIRLKEPRVAKLAIKGGAARDLVITHYVRVPFCLENGTWDAGDTFFKVADLEEPFEVILGSPFLTRHRIDISFTPSPALLLKPLPSQSHLPTLDLLAPTFGPRTLGEARRAATGLERAELEKEEDKLRLAAVLERVGELEKEQEEMDRRRKDREELAELDASLRQEFADLFPTELPPVVDNTSPVRHRIDLVQADPNKIPNRAGYACPRRYRESWRRLLDQHIAAGRLRPSSSPYSSPAFIIPKKDPAELPRWVNDYRQLNSNTVKDRTPLPLPDEVLQTCASASVWGKIDMTNSFFQTKMEEGDIPKTAVKTPWGLYEWVVMPMGLCNAPATHQRRVNEALGDLAGRICYAYLDDIIIWASSLKEHKERCRMVLERLRKAGLYCSPKKTELASRKVGFLGHVISAEGIEADPAKIDKIVKWTLPSTIKQLRGFLGLVQYLRKFIPGLAEHTARLTPLTKKGLSESLDGRWSRDALRSFEAIKGIVVGLVKLRPLDHGEGAEPIWVMTDASQVGLGAVLLQGKTWETGYPVGYHSRQFIPAEKNYPVHEQELLAIVDTLKAWRMELLGVPFQILSDHDTLTRFMTQRNFSKRQARWLETLSEFDFTITHIPGEKNAAADAMSRFSFPSFDEPVLMVAGVSTVGVSSGIVQRIKGGYSADPFCVQALKNVRSVPGWELKEGLLSFEGRIVIPADVSIREALLADAHDSLGHLGARKTLAALSEAYYWEKMASSVQQYVSSCDECQRNKSRTTPRAGELHALPVPSRPLSDVALDFVGPLPTSEGFDTLLTITDRLSGYVRLVPSKSKDGAKEVSERFFEGWGRLFGNPERLVSDRDVRFTNHFWRALHRRLGVKLQMSTAFHPQTDGRSEKTNKTAVQVLRGLVSRSQTDWVSHLGATEYALNAMVNSATGQSAFDLVLGFTPSLSPRVGTPVDVPAVEELLAAREAKLSAARDAMAAAKVRGAEQSNKKRGEEPDWKVGDLVMIDTKDRRARLKEGHGGTGVRTRRSAKLLARWDGPYPITEVFPEQSQYKLKLSANDKSHNMFHVEKLKAYVPNPSADFPSREPPRPDPILVADEEEFFVEAILDEKGVGRNRRFLVHWRGYPHSDDSFEPLSSIKDTVAYDEWEKKKKLGGGK